MIINHVIPPPISFMLIKTFYYFISQIALQNIWLNINLHGLVVADAMCEAW